MLLPVAPLFALVRPLLHRLDAERAHALTLRAVRAGLGGSGAGAPAGLRQHLFGRDFANPIGIAAGFDKDALVPDRLAGLAFGFVEVGTVTPRPQAGNSRPRLFRLPADRAAINRMGFNNAGMAAMAGRLAAAGSLSVPLAINIGANNDSADRIADYAAAMACLAPLADLIVVNVSSPNTPGLRDLQAPAALAELLAAVHGAQPPDGPRPILVKLSPDIADADVEATVTAAIDAGAAGLIVANTTIARPPGLRGRHRGEAGGLSGRPLFEPSTALLRRVHEITRGTVPLIGVGGIDSIDTAYEKIRAGASLIQLYTGLIYEGPGLIDRLIAGLEERLRADGFANISEAVAADLR